MSRTDLIDFWRRESCKRFKKRVKLAMKRQLARQPKCNAKRVDFHSFLDETFAVTVRTNIPPPRIG